MIVWLPDDGEKGGGRERERERGRDTFYMSCIRRPRALSKCTKLKAAVQLCLYRMGTYF